MQHRHIWRWLAATGLLASAATTAAQTSDQLAAQRRAAKRAEIVAQIAALNRKLGQLDDKATPDSFAETALAAASTPTPPPSPTPSPSPTPTPSPTPSPSPLPTGAATGTKPFGGLAFGVGISLTLDSGKKDRIGSASLDANKIVRVDDKNNSNARVMLESHYFFTPDGPGPFTLYNVGDTRDEETGELKQRGSKEWGFGPFVALQPGSGEIIDAVGLGIMAGFRRPGADSGSFNLGIGAVIDPNVRILGDGIEANRPLPAGETEVRYRETSQLGVLLLSSFTF